MYPLYARAASISADMWLEGSPLPFMALQAFFTRLVKAETHVMPIPWLHRHRNLGTSPGEPLITKVATRTLTSGFNQEGNKKYVDLEKGFHCLHIQVVVDASKPFTAAHLDNFNHHAFRTVEPFHFNKLIASSSEVFSCKSKPQLLILIVS